MSKELIDNAKYLRKIGEGIGEPICFAAAYELESLRRSDVLNQRVIADLSAQLKEAQAEIERLKGSRETCTLVPTNSLKSMQYQLAASQAREVQLREALQYSLGAWHYEGVSDEHGSIFKEANDRCDSPSDTTALESMIQKAGEVMRERCGTRPGVQHVVGADYIRALPGVTLEDLK